MDSIVSQQRHGLLLPAPQATVSSKPWLGGFFQRATATQVVVTHVAVHPEA